MIRVLVADDNPVIRQGLASLLGASDGIRVVGEAADGQEAIELARRTAPDVVLLDVRMPVTDGVSAAAVLSRSTRVLMLTYSEEDDIVMAAIRAGASGYLVHGRFEVDELERAVRAVAAGQGALSPSVAGAVCQALRGEEPTRAGVAERVAAAALSEREAEIMRLLARGLSNADIAGRLYVSEKTVKNHLNRIYAKLGVRNRGEAMAAWLGVVESGTSGP